MLAAWFTLQIILVLVAVQLMDRARWRQLASAAAVLAALLLPAFVATSPLPGAMLACLGLLALVKVLQVAPEPERWSPRYRLWHSLAPFDVADTHRVDPIVDRSLLLAIAVHAAIALAAFLILFNLPRGLPFSVELLRLVLGAALAYSGMEAITEGVRFVHLLAGVQVPAIQRMPILAQSISEFWSQRWNRPVSGWLNQYVFRPVSRRGDAMLGVLAAFLASGLLHAWMFFCALGWLAALMAVAFFFFQGVFVLVETTIGIRRQSLVIRRVWTLGLLLLSSPLFVEPMLQVLGV